MLSVLSVQYSTKLGRGTWGRGRLIICCNFFSGGGLYDKAINIGVVMLWAPLIGIISVGYSYSLVIHIPTLPMYAGWDTWKLCSNSYSTMQM